MSAITTKRPRSQAFRASTHRNRDTTTTSRPGLSPYTGHLKPRIAKKDHVYPSKGKPHLCHEYPTIVKLDDGWAETWCHVCGANSTKRGFLAGLVGLLYHVNTQHKQQQQCMTLAKLVTVCGLHYLKEDEFAAICLREKKVNRTYEDEPVTKSAVNELTDEQHSRRASARLGLETEAVDTSAEVWPRNTNVDHDDTDVTDEEIVVEHRQANSAAPHGDGDTEDELLGPKIKKEAETDVAYGDEDLAQRMESDIDDDGDIVVSQGPARKRRRLRALPEPDDEDEYVP